MRLLNALLLLALAPFASAAAKPARGTTNVNVYSKLSELTRTASTPGIVQLDSKMYDQIIAPPRNYTSVVLLTAQDPKYKCQMCKILQPEYELLAKSWSAKHKDGDGLFFTVLDFDKGKETFVRLNLNTAPVLVLFPPTTGPGADPMHALEPYNFEFIQQQIPAESLAAWVASHSPHSPTITRPFDYSKIVIGTGALIVALSILKLAFKTLKPAIYSRNLWAALALILILLFTSGHMFNHIRRVPYVANNGRGGVSYIAGGFSNQFGMETQIVAVVYAVLAFSAISLGMKVPTIEDPGRQKLAVWLWSGVLMLTFSFLMSLFRQKNGGYPFRLPPLM